MHFCLTLFKQVCMEILSSWFFRRASKANKSDVCTVKVGSFFFFYFALMLCRDLSWGGDFSDSNLCVAAQLPQSVQHGTQNLIVCIVRQPRWHSSKWRAAHWHVNQMFLTYNVVASTSPSFCLASEWQSAAAAQVLSIWSGEGIFTPPPLWQQTRVVLHIITREAQKGLKWKVSPGAPVWAINSISDCPRVSDSCQVRAEDSARPAEQLIHHVWGHVQLILTQCVCLCVFSDAPRLWLQSRLFSRSHALIRFPLLLPPPPSQDASVSLRRKDAADQTEPPEELKR